LASIILVIIYILFLAGREGRTWIQGEETAQAEETSSRTAPNGMKVLTMASASSGRGKS
jgi:hypothetical protein